MQVASWAWLPPKMPEQAGMGLRVQLDPSGFVPLQKKLNVTHLAALFDYLASFYGKINMNRQQKLITEL